MKCNRPGCEQEVDNYWRMYCDDRCKQLTEIYHMERVVAQLEGGEPPSMDELCERRERAKRWTPETMETYIENIKEGERECPSVA